MQQQLGATTPPGRLSAKATPQKTSSFGIGDSHIINIFISKLH